MTDTERTKKATEASLAARLRRRHERMAAELHEAGWEIHEPGVITTYPRGLVAGVQSRQPCGADYGYGACTLPTGHDERHEVSDGRSVVARWVEPAVA